MSLGPKARVFNLVRRTQSPHKSSSPEATAIFLTEAVLPAGLMVPCCLEPAGVGICRTGAQTGARTAGPRSPHSRHFSNSSHSPSPSCPFWGLIAFPQNPCSSSCSRLHTAHTSTRTPPPQEAVPDRPGHRPLSTMSSQATHVPPTTSAAVSIPSAAASRPPPQAACDAPWGAGWCLALLTVTSIGYGTQDTKVSVQQSSD